MDSHGVYDSLFTRAFITGSRRFGTPREDSDLDVVMLVDPTMLPLLAQHSDPVYDPSVHYGKISAFRFGDLNIIALTDATEFDIWERVSSELAARVKTTGKPVTRNQAITALVDAGIGND